MNSNQDLSDQATCNCSARPGQQHHMTCQYVADLLAQVVERATR